MHQNFASRITVKWTAVFCANCAHRLLRALEVWLGPHGEAAEERKLFDDVALREYVTGFFVALGAIGRAFKPQWLARL